MNVQERIDLLNDALAKVQSAIAKTNTALGTAVALGDNQSLASQLTDLHAEQESLRTRIANLQMAAPTIGFIAPEAAVRLSALGGELVNTGKECQRGEHADDLCFHNFGLSFD